MDPGMQPEEEELVDRKPEAHLVNNDTDSDITRTPKLRIRPDCKQKFTCIPAKGATLTSAKASFNWLVILGYCAEMSRPTTNNPCAYTIPLSPTQKNIHKKKHKLCIKVILFM